MLFLDESGYSDPKKPAKYPEADFFVIGGIIIQEKNYDECIDKFKEFKSENFPPGAASLPIHAVELNQLAYNSDSKYKEYLQPEEAKAILKKTYEFIATLPLEAIAITIDNVELRKKYTYPENPYEMAYRIIVEKFQSIIDKRNEIYNRFGIINLSHSNYKLTKKISEIHSSIIKNGTDYVRFTKIFPKVNIEATSQSPYFEIADLVCYAFNRFYRNWLCLYMGKKTNTEEDYLMCLEPICRSIKIGKITINKKIRTKYFPSPRFLKKNGP